MNWYHMLTWLTEAVVVLVAAMSTLLELHLAHMGVEGGVPPAELHNFLFEDAPPAVGRALDRMEAAWK